MTSSSKRILALIPAKGASTRLPRKNILPLGGKPLIRWTIDAAKAAGMFERIVVSTEDTEVADVARSAGADVPFERPAELSVDPAGVVQVALHALEVLEDEGQLYDEICILLPTCPFRNASDITDAFSLFRSRPEQNLMSVGPCDHTPFNAVGIGEDELLFPHFPDHFGRKSQEMPSAFHPNGALHILDVAWFREARSYLTPPVLAYPMARERSLDIDCQEDLVMAEAMIVSGAVESSSNA